MPMFEIPFTAQTLLRTGARHLRKGINNQDHATVRVSDSAVILAVSDGISVPVWGRDSHTEVGAYLVAELAAAAAAQVVADGLATSVPNAVAAALSKGLAPLTASLGESVLAAAIPSTLVLAVLTPTTTDIWLSGDGAWGVVLPPAFGTRLSRLTKTVHTGPTKVDREGFFVQGSLHLGGLKELTSVSAMVGDIGEARRALQHVLSAPSGSVACWVSTDGIRDEPGLHSRLTSPARQRSELVASLDLPIGGHALTQATTGAKHDDLGLAFASTFVEAQYG